MRDFELAAFLPYQLAVLSSRISREFAGIYQREHGLSVAEWRVIAHLSQREFDSVREIHARAGMDKSMISRAVDRLAAAGLVAKTKNTDDRRLISLSLTNKGRTLMGRLSVLAREFDATVRKRLPAGSAEPFAVAMAHLLEETS